MELKWWFINIFTQKREITHGVPELIINTDASQQGWGAVLEHNQTGGRWKKEEIEKHINYLEMLAIFYALKAFSKFIRNKHVEILTDNSTAVFYINNMGVAKI